MVKASVGEHKGPLFVGDGEGQSRKGALDGVRVLDLTDERAIYGAKLLADLGADVVRAEAEEGDPLRQRGPFHGASGAEPDSLWHAFYRFESPVLPHSG